MIRRTAVLALTLLSVVGLDGCRRKVVQAPAPAATSNDAQRQADSLAALRAQQRADSIAAAEAARAASATDERSAGELAAVLTQKVYFDYDQDVLRDDARAVLDAKVPILLANPGVTVAITGHTDERGTAEYNLALGEKRANAVRAYLVNLGVAESRLTIVSKGKEAPVCSDANEACWQQNLRGHFVITAK